MEKTKLGFLRETQEEAIKAGVDKDQNIERTGLEIYLKIIFPEINDWVHDQTVPNLTNNGKKSKIRPDYRSETLKMVIEFDGLPHYQNVEIIIKDEEKNKIYEANGYKVVRIPYFIQLTNEIVYQLFGINVKDKLFDPNIPSLGINGRYSPAFLCPLGITRMARDFIKFPQQYEINKNYLKQFDDKYTGLSYLEREINYINLKNENINSI